MGTISDRFFKSSKTSALIAILSLSCAAWVPPAHAAKLIWTGDFETGDLSQYRKKVYNEGTYGFMDVVNTPVRAGKYAARAIAKGPGRKRAELVSSVPGTGKMKFLWDGPEYWIGFSLYFSEWNAAGNTFTQIHAPNEDTSKGQCDFAGNTFTVMPSGNGGKDAKGFPIENTLGVRVLDNPSGMSESSGANSNNIKVWDTKNTPGVWHDFVARFKLSTKGDGYYEVWHNGKKIYSRFNMYNVNWIDSCGNRIPADKRKHNGIHIGLYAGGNDQYLRMYFDEVRIAEGSNGYDLVAPPGGGNVQAAAVAPPAPPSGLQ